MAKSSKIAAKKSSGVEALGGAIPPPPGANHYFSFRYKTGDWLVFDVLANRPDWWVNHLLTFLEDVCREREPDAYELRADRSDSILQRRRWQLERAADLWSSDLRPYVDKMMVAGGLNLGTDDEDLKRRLWLWKESSDRIQIWNNDPPNEEVEEAEPDEDRDPELGPATDDPDQPPDRNKGGRPKKWADLEGTIRRCEEKARKEREDKPESDKILKEYNRSHGQGICSGKKPKATLQDVTNVRKNLRRTPK